VWPLINGQRLAVFDRTVDPDGVKYERIGSAVLMVGGEYGSGVISVFVDGGRLPVPQRVYLGADEPRDDDRAIPPVPGVPR
jgi:hypothetical protein